MEFFKLALILVGAFFCVALFIIAWEFFINWLFYKIGL